MENKSSKQSAGGYGGKHSKLFWAIVYIVAAVVVYGLIYLLFIHKSGSGSSGATNGYGY